MIGAGSNGSPVDQSPVDQSPVGSPSPVPGSGSSPNPVPSPAPQQKRGWFWRNVPVVGGMVDSAYDASSAIGEIKGDTTKAITEITKAATIVQGSANLFNTTVIPETTALIAGANGTVAGANAAVNAFNTTVMPATTALIAGAHGTIADTKAAVTAFTTTVIPKISEVAERFDKTAETITSQLDDCKKSIETAVTGLLGTPQVISGLEKFLQEIKDFFKIRFSKKIDENEEFEINDNNREQIKKFHTSGEKILSLLDTLLITEESDDYILKKCLELYIAEHPGVNIDLNKDDDKEEVYKIFSYYLMKIIKDIELLEKAINTSQASAPAQDTSEASAPEEEISEAPDQEEDTSETSGPAQSASQALRPEEEISEASAPEQITSQASGPKKISKKIVEDHIHKLFENTSEFKFTFYDRTAQTINQVGQTAEKAASDMEAMKKPLEKTLEAARETLNSLRPDNEKYTFYIFASLGHVFSMSAIILLRRLMDKGLCCPKETIETWVVLGLFCASFIFSGAAYRKTTKAGHKDYQGFVAVMVPSFLVATAGILYVLRIFGQASENWIGGWHNESLLCFAALGITLSILVVSAVHYALTMFWDKLNGKSGTPAAPAAQTSQGSQSTPSALNDEGNNPDTKTPEAAPPTFLSAVTQQSSSQDTSQGSSMQVQEQGQNGEGRGL